VNVLALTIFVSFLLGAMFALLWLVQAIDSRNFSERDALLPLEADASESPTLDPKTHS